MRKLLLVLLACAAVACGSDDGEVHGRSGFWTSNRPAQGGAYRWRLLGLGVVIAGVTGIVMVRILRKAGRERR